MSNTLNEVWAAIDGSIASISAANSAKRDITDAKRVTFQFTRADHSSGNNAFVVEVSNDGSNWYTYNKLISNVTNDNTEYLTRVAAPTLSSNTSEIYSISPEDKYRFVRVYHTRTTDGTADCDVMIQYY